jgi:hypothetical protein
VPPSPPHHACRLHLFQRTPIIPSLPIAYPSSPPIPPTSHSASTSPASSVSPQTPPNTHGPGLVKVTSAESSPVEAPVIPHGHGPTSASAKLKPIVPALAASAVPLKLKSAHDQVHDGLSGNGLVLFFFNAFFSCTRIFCAALTLFFSFLPSTLPAAPYVCM